MTVNLPLADLRIVVTRPKGQADSMIESLQERGANPVLFPVIRIQAQARVPGLKSAIENLDRYDWLIFTSVNGVRIFWDWMGELGTSPEGLTDLRVAAIGPATADSLRERGITDVFVPDDFVGEALGEQIPDVQGKRILLPRAAGSRPALPEKLVWRGATVDEFALYRAIQSSPGSRVLAQLRQGVDVITFTSPSTVRQFSAILEENHLNPRKLPGSPTVACIGPITAGAARRAGYAVQIVAQDYTVDGLIQALMDSYAEGGPT